jgi:hypothetical protein
MVPGPFSDYLAFENPLDGRLTLVKETQKKSHQQEKNTDRLRDGF